MSVSGSPGTAMMSAKKPGLSWPIGVGPVEKLRAVDEAGAEGVGGAHAVLHHQLVLARLRAMRERTDVGADSEGNACGHLLLELCGVEVELGWYFSPSPGWAACWAKYSMMAKVGTA